VTARVSPSERIRAQLDELIAGVERGSLADHFERVARLAVRLVLQAALEAEITEFLGRDRYARGERDRDGHRNGYAPVSIKTTAGEVTLERPKVRGTAAAFASRLLGVGVTRTNALESLVIAGFVRGLSVRDVEASLADALGPQATVSKSTVSRICEAIKQEFNAWKVRSLAEVELEYLFADGSFFRMHPGAPAEPVLVAWGITAAGKPVLLGLEPGNAESTDAWAGFFGGLKAGGLGDPLLVISDGGAGLIGAIELCFAQSLRQRCLVHRARNLLAKVPAHAQAKVKAEYWAIFDDLDAEPGEAAVAEATRRARSFTAKWRKLYPSAVACLQDDFEHLVTYLRFPAEHQGASATATSSSGPSARPAVG
jgi:putative transposase